MANAITLVEMVDLTLADLKAEIAILKSSAARDISTTIAPPFAPPHSIWDHHHSGETQVRRALRGGLSARAGAPG
jgi:hypothetical protein